MLFIGGPRAGNLAQAAQLRGPNGLFDSARITPFRLDQVDSLGDEVRPPQTRPSSKVGPYRERRREKRTGLQALSMFPYITLVGLALLLVETQFCFTIRSDGSPGRVRVGRSRRRAESSGRRRRWILRAAVVPCSLLLAEGLLQLLCLVSLRVDWLVAPTSRRGLLIPDTALGHRGNPSYFLEHDRRGYRNERAVAKADIAVLGDSQTYGDGASRANAWPQQLAALTGYSVYNMGMGGWGPVQYRTVLDDALALEPRVILVGLYFGNDLYDAYHMAYHSPSGADLRDPTVTVALRALDREAPLEPTIRTLSHATLHAAPGLPPVDLATTASTAAGIEPSLPTRCTVWRGRCGDNRCHPNAHPTDPCPRGTIGPPGLRRIGPNTFRRLKGRRHEPCSPRRTATSRWTSRTPASRRGSRCRSGSWQRSAGVAPPSTADCWWF